MSLLIWLVGCVVSFVIFRVFPPRGVIAEVTEVGSFDNSRYHTLLLCVCWPLIVIEWFIRWIFKV